jgi:hypothetical protein
LGVDGTPGNPAVRKGHDRDTRRRTERSQEVIESKRDHFLDLHQSQEVLENTGFIFVKPRGY